jgi:hypothetical protein
VKGEREDKLRGGKEKVIETRLNKLRHDAEVKLEMIQEFRKTLDKIEWNDQI